MKSDKAGYVLAVDCGTQSLRTLIFDQEGHLLAKVKDSYEPYYAKKAGLAEKDPESYWLSFVSCMEKLNRAAADLMDDVVAITVTTIRDTNVYLDKAGKVVRPSMLFLDQREAKCEDRLPWIHVGSTKLVNMYRAIEASRKQCKSNWMKENEPDLWDKTKHLLLLSGYFHYKLTGRFVDSIANQIGHIPINFRTKTWDKKGGLNDSMFPIERDKLPQLVQPGTDIGPIDPEVGKLLGLKADIRVLAGGSDKGCETLGVGCLDPTKISLSFGTAATIQTTTDRYMEPVQFVPPYPAVHPDKYNPEIQVYRGYWMIRWFKREFADKEVRQALEMGITPERLLNKRLKDIAPGAEGLMLQPYWKPSLRNPDARGAIIGFSDYHNRYHIYRAIIEGINYALIDGMERIQKKTKTKVEKVMVSGGGSQSEIICQITADMFNRPVVRGETYEASGLGAAINAFVGLGVYDSYEAAVDNMVREKDVFEPNPLHVKTYEALFQRVYKQIYPKLKGIYREMGAISETINGGNHG